MQRGGYAEPDQERLARFARRVVQAWDARTVGMQSQGHLDLLSENYECRIKSTWVMSVVN